MNETGFCDDDALMFGESRVIRCCNLRRRCVVTRNVAQGKHPYRCTTYMYWVRVHVLDPRRAENFFLSISWLRILVCRATTAESFKRQSVYTFCTQFSSAMQIEATYMYLLTSYHAYVSIRCCRFCLVHALWRHIATFNVNTVVRLGICSDPFMDFIGAVYVIMYDISCLNIQKHSTLQLNVNTFVGY